MIFPINVDVPMDRWPIANWILIAVTCMVSFAAFSESEGVEGLLLWRGEGFAFHQLFTHSLLHADIIHLAGNMVMLWVFGNAVNARLGHLIYLLSYAALALLAGLAWLAIDGGEAALGASGAIMGIVGLFLVYYPRNDVSIFYWIGWWFMGTFSISAYVVILVYVAFDLLGFAMQSEEGGGIAYVAHLGGAAAGFGIGAALVLSGLVPPGKGEQTIFQAANHRPKEHSGSRRATASVTPLRPPPVRRPPPADDAPIPLVGDEPQPRRTPAAPARPTPKPPPGGWR